jgi:Sulfotransferase domain
LLANKEEPIDDLQMAKYFRSFEISNEWSEIQYSEKSIFYYLPKIIAGFFEYQFLSYYFSNPPKWRMFVRKLLRKKRIVPDYVMTGPAKSGSSDLVSHLLLHPNVMHPLAKEIRVHSFKDWRNYYPTVKEKKRLEKKINHPVRCGCLEPFLHVLTGLNKLYDANPDSKIIITLRDPVARAYSHWKYEIWLGGKSFKNNSYFQSFDKYVERAIDLFPSVPMETVFGSQVLQTGIYYKAVEQWVKRFSRENVMVLDVAEYFLERQSTLEKIQRFLDLPVVHIPEYGKKANENPIELPPPDQKTKSTLAEFYKPYNQKLFDIINTDFDWQ